MKILALLLFALLLSAGQMLFKKAALETENVPFLPGLMTRWTMLALCLYAVATALWIWILRTTPLSTAYPFLAMSFIIVPLGASLLFGEQLNPRYYVGCCLVIAGIIITSR